MKIDHLQWAVEGKRSEDTITEMQRSFSGTFNLEIAAVVFLLSSFLLLETSVALSSFLAHVVMFESKRSTDLDRL